MMTSKINGRQPQTHKKNEDDLKKKAKNGRRSKKKSTLIGCDTIVNQPSQVLNFGYCLSHWSKHPPTLYLFQSHPLDTFPSLSPIVQSHAPDLRNPRWFISPVCVHTPDWSSQSVLPHRTVQLVPAQLATQFGFPTLFFPFRSKYSQGLSS